MNEHNIELQGGKLRLRSNQAHPKHQAKRALHEFDAALDDLTDNWKDLNANQKQEAFRRMIVVLAKTVRWLVQREKQG